MAAVLKKRVVAELTQVQQEGALPPAKKLRLTYRPPSAELTFDLSGCTTPSQTFQVLLELEQRLPLAPVVVQPTVTVLLERLGVERESAVRAKLIALLSCLAHAPACDTLTLADALIALLTAEKSSVVQSALLGALLSTAQAEPASTKLHRTILQLACQFLSSSSHLVRCKCLLIMGALGSPDLVASLPVQGPGEGQGVEGGQGLGAVDPPGLARPALRVLSSYCYDADPRVRTGAFQSMLAWHKRGLRLEQGVYRQACLALTDDSEGVRLVAVKLIWVLAQLYPNSIIMTATSGDSIRLVDDGFANICNVVNDLSVRVRAEAAGLLGSLRSVSPRFLEQTLDKKLMSNMRLKRSAHERQREYFESGEWSSGQKWADDAPRDDVDPDSVSLITSGACGAFVHGLEDEYLEVRNAAIDSLCRLASDSPDFAKLSQDFLVDMFNDEIESVRLNAIHSLRNICHHFLLREDQLEIIISVLKDFNVEIREALRGMLSHCRLSTKACLNVLVVTLLENLRRYPDDKYSVWKCMKDLGRHHSSLVLSMVPELLCVHPFFESVEPDIEDPAYVSVLALVFNAAVDSPTMMSLFPNHVAPHYTYLRDAQPDLLPPLKLAGAESVLSLTKARPHSSIKEQTFLEQTLARLSGLQLLDHRSAVQLMRISIRDLEQVREIEPKMAATADCVVLFLHCLLHLDKSAALLPHLRFKRMMFFHLRLHDIFLASQSSSSSDGAVMVFNSQREHSLQTALVGKVLESIRRMEHQYLSLGVEERAQICVLSLRARTLQLLAALQGGGQWGEQGGGQGIDRTLAAQQYLRFLTGHEELLSSSKLDVSTQLLLRELSALLRSCDHASAQHRAIALSQRLRTPLTSLTITNQLRRAMASISEPSGSSDAVLKFCAGLATCVSLIATVQNVRDLTLIRIQVTYPDQQTYLVNPSPLDFRQLSELHHRLVTKVLLSHSVWSEPSSVRLCVVLLCADATEDVTGRSRTSAAGLKPEQVIEISQSVTVSVLPVAARKL